MDTRCSMLDARRNRKTSIENRVTRIEMFTISVKTHFWASHKLALSKSRRVASDNFKEPPHQHNWSVTAEVTSNRLNELGLVMDFNQLKSMLDEITAGFDNKSLEKFDYFQKSSPSAENIAKFIYENLKPKLPKGIKLQSIIVVEEPGCSAKFTKEKNK